MGYGDDLMITAHASLIKKKFPDRQIVIGNVSKKQAYHSVVYDNNPNISNCQKLNKSLPIHIIDYHPGNRPYIDYKKSTNLKYIWNKDFKPQPGELFLSEKEIQDGKKIISQAINNWDKKNNKKFKKIIFIETTSTKIKDKQFSIKHQNKDWGINNWLNLIEKLKKDHLVILSVHNETEIIDGVYAPKNVNFRLACSILYQSDIYIGPEGGFGHVAAAFRKKAVIYFGGWIDPQITGYDFHENIYFENQSSPCGEYKNLCNHCSEARKKITVDYYFQ